MIAYTVFSLILAVIIIFITAKLSICKRVSILTVFAIMALFLLLFLIRNFDEPTEGSRIITREEINSWSRNK
jgi:O-antigen ligase